MLRWIYERHSFWGLPCYACGGSDGWHTLFCGWRSNSYIAVACCRKCGAEQFLKRYRRPVSDDGTCLAQWEYDVLCHLSRAGYAPSFLLPTVFRFAAATCALSMQYLRGETMDERMRRAVDRRDLDDCLRVSAMWLRGLHATPPLRDKTGNGPATMLLRLESDCGLLAGRNAVAARALLYMRSCLHRVSSLPVELVPLHGDFKASNLIWTEDGIYGVDIGMRFKNAGVMDAAQFIADVLLNRCSMKAIASEYDTAAVLGVFLEAYDDNSKHKWQITAWWLLYFLLSRWEEDRDGWKPSIIVDRAYVSAVAEVMAFCGRNGFAEAA
ncbi:MAG: phosphotransferase [Nitrosospira sp.]|nr:phosphotransferase [Nitrosospira sp.]